MKKQVVLSMVVWIILTSCIGQREMSVVIPSATMPTSAKGIPTQLPFTPTLVLPTFTLTPSLTATPFKKPTSTKIFPTQLPSTPTFTPFPPYHNKGVIFSYSVIGNYADFGVFFNPVSVNIITKLILYDDGQMLIAGDGETYQQKILSADEIRSFLQKLETLGFFSLESNQKHDPTDKLYVFGNEYQKIADGLWDCIMVKADKSRELYISDGYLQYLIPEMKNILKYLDEYKPSGLTPYYPDRIFLSIYQVDPSSAALSATPVPWNEHYPSLEFIHPSKYQDISSSTMYIDGDMAKEIYMYFSILNGSGVFIYNSNTYIVYIRVLLPDEKVINAYQ